MEQNVQTIEFLNQITRREKGYEKQNKRWRSKSWILQNVVGWTVLKGNTLVTLFQDSFWCCYFGDREYRLGWTNNDLPMVCHQFKAFTILSHEQMQDKLILRRSGKTKISVSWYCSNYNYKYLHKMCVCIVVCVYNCTSLHTASM